MTSLYTVCHPPFFFPPCFCFFTIQSNSILLMLYWQYRGYFHFHCRECLLGTKCNMAAVWMASESKGPNRLVREREREIDTNNTFEKERWTSKKKKKRMKEKESLFHDSLLMLHNRFLWHFLKGKSSPRVIDSKLMVVKKCNSSLATPGELRSRRNETK